MSVIDAALRFPQCAGMLTHEEIRAEMIRQLEAGEIKGARVAELLGIPPPRVAEMRKMKRRVQYSEMAPLATFLKMPGADAIPPAPWTPTDATLARMLVVEQRALSASRDRADVVPRLAHGLAAGIKLLAEAPEQEGDEGFLLAVERTITRALRDYKPQLALSA